MTYTPFFVGPVQTGLQLNLDPYLIPDDAFQQLVNAYLWRGRVYRKGGNQLLGQLGVRTDTLANRTAGADVYNSTTAYNPIQPGSLVITDGVTIFFDLGNGNFGITGAGTQNAPINYTTGAYNITFNVGNAGASVTANYIVLPNANSPVMGLRTYEKISTAAPFVGNNKNLIAFDLIKSYFFNSGFNAFRDVTFYKTSGTAFQWTGTDTNFFTSTNYQNAFWAINNVYGFQSNPQATIGGAGDGIRWFDNTAGGGWINFLPPLEAGGGPRKLMGGLLVFPYKDRLVFLNTVEGVNYAGATQFPQRARWSQIGTVYYDAGNLPAGVTASNANAWFDTTQGANGGFVDATTSEQIISAELIKDILIVYFESSTWALESTGDQLLPFRWRKINKEIGSRSPFSAIAFDKGVLTVNENGVFTCDGVNVERIDRVIPDIAFTINGANNGQLRVQGIRDFFSEMTYWTYPSIYDQSYDGGPTKYPRNTLVYNYLTQSYSQFIQSFTAFGYFYENNNLTWQTAIFSWQSAAKPWNSVTNANGMPLVVAGNQQGFVFFLEDSDGENFVGNAASLFVSNVSNANPSVFTCVNHNLMIGDFVLFSKFPTAKGWNKNIYKVAAVPTANTFTVISATGSTDNFGADTFGGFVTIVDNFNITTKNLNPFFPAGKSMQLGYFDVYTDNLDSILTPVMTAFLYTNTDLDNPIEMIDVTLNDVTSISKVNEQFWSRVYANVTGPFLTVKFGFTDTTTATGGAGQMFDTDFISMEIVLRGFIFYMKTAGRNITV